MPILQPIMLLTRTSIRKIAFAVLATTMVGLAACSDSATLPSSPNSPTRGLTPNDAPSLNWSGSGTTGYQTMTFTLTDDADTINIGGLFTLKVPKNAVCTLNSPYGPGYWDSPCNTLDYRSSVTVTAKYGISSTGPEVNFSPELRFSPYIKVTLSTSYYSRTLTSNRNYYASHPSALSFVSMYFEAGLPEPLVADVSGDNSLATHVNLWSGNLWRRIKHFSGYNVTSGDCSGCDAPPPIIDY